jgi:EAL domain-containing protein (putative c-di-GMP-specific phosphodiesterase class I)
MSGRIVGVEALVRWRHPERGMILPDEFIPIAEETGLIGDLGEWVLRVACAQTRAWQDDGLPELVLGVNVSPRQFRDQRVADMVARILRSTGLAPWHLELELTEGLAMETADQTISALHELRAMGVQSSLDDFGTGYSSLSYLTRLPIERLKIDKSFVARIGPDHDGEDAAIVRAVIVLAHSLGLQVVAEGVETPEQLAFLREHGCDLMQGFLYSRPVPPEALREMLVRERERELGADVVPPAGAEALN